ncbi:MAG: serine/threonine-protein kinase [Verrucomicrobiota bacterium]
MVLDPGYEDSDSDPMPSEQKAFMRSFFSMKPEDMAEEEREMAYPIQSQLHKLDERYDIKDVLGEGAVKIVYRAYDKKTDLDVAMARPKNNSTQDEVERFFREARITARLKHPNIISVLDLGFCEEKVPYFTMELLEGRTFREVIGDGKLEASRLLDIFFKVCDAVAFAHSLKVIHLDIKPDNINVGDYGEVRLCDWGLAKILTVDDVLSFEEDMKPDILNHVTIHGRIKGSPGFMAPEQASSGNKDFRTDIFSLGALLYTLYVGDSPIRGDTVDELLRKTKMVETVPIPNDIRVPKPIQAIIGKCLAREPKERYQDVLTLHADLNNYLDGYATLAENAGFFTHVRLLVSRHRKAVAILTSMAVLIVFVVFLAFMKVNEARVEALDSQQLAMQQKQLAEKNFQLLKEQYGLNEELHREAQNLTMGILSSDDLKNAQKNIKLLKDSLKRESDPPKRDKMLDKMGELYFVLLDFEKALEAFEQKQSNKGSKLHILCKSIEKTIGFKTAYSDREMTSILTGIYSVRTRDLLIATYASYMKKFRRQGNEQQDYIELANLVLDAYNHLWTGSQRGKLSLKGGVLKVPPKPYSQFFIWDHGINIFQYLVFNELDVSHSDFFAFHNLKHLGFESLNIAGCKVNEIHARRVAVIRRIGIRHITYDSRYLSEKEIQLLKENFTTVDVADEEISD